MKRRRALAFVVSLLAFAWVRFAAAAGEEAAGVVTFRLGQAAEESGAFDEALARYRACVAEGSTAPAGAMAREWAQRASERIEWIGARSEGHFEPLRRLLRVMRDPDLANDPRAVEDLAREADRMPPGTVRLEARMLVAEAFLGRMNRPDAALAPLRRVVEDPLADPLTARLAERELVGALAKAGRTDDASAEARAHAALLDPRFLRQTERLVRRRTVRRGCTLLLASFLAMAARALLRAKLRGALSGAAHSIRRFAPVAAAFVAFVVGAGGLLASQYESGNAFPFLLLGAGALPLLFATRAWSAVGSEKRPARVARAFFCGATVLATAFVLLDATNPTYLEGFGL